MYIEMLNQYPMRPVLRQGDDEWFVALLRGCLAEAGLHEAAVIDPKGDGRQLLKKFDGFLDAYVRQFQRQHGLEMDGVVGSQTWAGLAGTPTPDESVEARQGILKAARYLCDVEPVRELTGKNDGPMVKAILEFGKGSEGMPWCMAFATGCARFGMALAGEYAPAGMATLSCSALVDWAKQHKRVTQKPQPADLFVLSGGDRGFRHVGIIEDIVGQRTRPIYITIEGNTSQDPADIRQDSEGDGVYRRHRDPAHTLGVVVRVV